MTKFIGKQTNKNTYLLLALDFIYALSSLQIFYVELKNFWSDKYFEEDVIFSLRLWGIIGVGLLLISFLFLRDSERVSTFLGNLTSNIAGYAKYLLFVGSLLLYGFFSLSPNLNWNSLFFFQNFLLLFFVTLGTMFLSGTSYPFEKILFFSLALYIIIISLGKYLLYINDYPLSLGWSETSSYYYASTFLSKFLYGKKLMLPYRHHSRYLLLIFPFLISNAPIWIHRLWENSLWIITPLLTSYLLLRRLNLKITYKVILWFIGIVLFILQGPIYYHLLLIPICIFWLFDSQKFWRSLFLVIVLSAWAAISRVNWIPVPGFLAAMLYLMERPVTEHKDKISSIYKYLLFPSGWVLIGGITGILTRFLLPILFKVEKTILYTDFNSTLLWYRLLPNPTYRLGILLGSVLVSLPGFYFIFKFYKARSRLYNILRVIGICIILLVFFLGGLIVSIKIGGSSNLHNMDAYLLFLAVSVVYLYFNFVGTDNRDTFILPQWALMSLILIPIIYVSGFSRPIPELDHEKADETIRVLQRTINEFSRHENDVLLMTEHQLFTFNYLSGLEQKTIYEKTFVMEMAMSENYPVLKQYWDDFQNQKFSVIIGEKMSSGHSVGQYAKENYYFIEHIADHLRCYYKKHENLPINSIEIYIPRKEPCKE